MEKPGNLIMVIFGASGDLTSRKLIPALFSLSVQKLLPGKFAVFGTGRTKMTDESFRAKMKESIFSFSEEKEISSIRADEFIRDLYYEPMDIAEPKSYRDLKNILDSLDKRYGTEGNIIFYLAVPPSGYQVIAENLAAAGLADESKGFRRFILEKPFGYDYESACSLNLLLHNLMKEEQIFRIDHYLGKETVQNLLVTRFANGIFEPLWNRNYIDRVEITSAESIGVSDRGSYYDSAGALRDMVQNHLLQMTGLTAMEPPSSLDPDAIRNEVLKVFQSFQPFNINEVEKQVIRGQYTASKIRGECITGYRFEKGVSRRSRTETYVAMKFYINNWRWGGVPFFVRTGKRLPTRVTEIVIHFKPTPHHLFLRNKEGIGGNQLILRIQPDEGILLKFDMKEPGSGFNVRNVAMDFHYKDLSDIRIPSAYERLLYDVMTGDSTLFSRDDEIETAWKFLSPVQKAWAERPEIKLYGYPAGTWGPESANSLIGGGNNTWRYPCRNMADEEVYCEL
ncbi:MAG: glucose-6-phosphate dehydrogenase [Bacteroidales bacterium]|nr:glucose-6-phosphate dehydrogenase [Bacteroidales bacterium]